MLADQRGFASIVTYLQAQSGTAEVDAKEEEEKKKKEVEEIGVEPYAWNDRLHRPRHLLKCDCAVSYV